MQEAKNVESTVNVHLADVLRSNGVLASEEQRVASGQPDVIVDAGPSCAVIEAEFEPARTVKEDALKRVGTMWKGKLVDRLYTVAYPEKLKTCPANKLKSALEETRDLRIEYKDSDRPSSWQTIDANSVESLAKLLKDHWVKQDGSKEIDGIVQRMSEAIEQAAGILMRTEAMVDPNEEAGITALVWLNAMLFQELLSSRLEGEDEGRIPPLDLDISATDLRAQWDDILKINWHPIFHSARESLGTVPGEKASSAIKGLLREAKRTAENQLLTRHDITGRIFHRLLDSRKFLATNYTTIPAAILLSGMAFFKDEEKEGVNYQSVEDLLKLSICDPACGTGTLLMSAAQEVMSRFIADDPKERGILTKTLLEECLHGFDVVPHAVHLTAATLSMAETKQKIDNTHLYCLRHEVGDNEEAYLGSLDLLSGGRSQYRIGLGGKEQQVAEQVTGTGDVKRGVVAIPKGCRLIIANPPYTRAGGPGNKENKEWNPIFGSLLNKKEIAVMKKAMNERLKSTPAGSLSGLGSAFLVLADQVLTQGSRLAFVLPYTVLTGTSWRPIRKMLQEKYRVEWVVVSHDRRSRGKKKGFLGRVWTSFSESTTMSETLIVATKKVRKHESYTTKFLNLRINPDTPIDAHSLLNRLKRYRSSEGVQEIVLGDQSWGEIVPVPSSELMSQAWYQTAFTQYRLIQKVKELLTGDQVPLAPLREGWTLGPAHTQIKSSKYGIFTITKTDDPTRLGKPALWHHSFKRMQTLESSANARLNRRASVPEQDMADMLSKTGKFHIATDLRANTQKIAAVVTDECMLGVGSWVTFKPIKKREGSEETMCLWMNSSIAVLLRVALCNKPYLGRIRMTHSSYKPFPVLDISQLSDAKLLVGKQMCERLKKKVLLPFKDMHRDSVRQQIDGFVCELLGLDKKDVARTAQELSREPIMLGTA